MPPCGRPAGADRLSSAWLRCPLPPTVAKTLAPCLRLTVSRQAQTTSPGGSLLRRPLAESSTGVDNWGREIGGLGHAVRLIPLVPLARRWKANASSNDLVVSALDQRHKPRRNGYVLVRDQAANGAAASAEPRIPFDDSPRPQLPQVMGVAQAVLRPSIAKSGQ